MTIVVGSQSFDTNGNILSRSTSDSISTVFTNLTEQHDYYYSLKTYSKNGEVLSHYIGLFSTSSETSIKKMETNEHNLEITGYYDLNGRKLAAPKKAFTSSAIPTGRHKNGSWTDVSRPSHPHAATLCVCKTVAVKLIQMTL